jgi:acyl-CoA dehydrogenase
MTVTVPRESGFTTAVREIADQVAAGAADAVDRENRFPHEAVAALREAKALSSFVSPAYGGGGVRFRELATACLDLGRACASTGMVFAMHQIQVGCIARHGAGNDLFDDYLRALVTEQRLIASVTTELGVGGDLRSSVAAAEPDGEAITFEKKAPTVSYAAHADDFLTTMRRAPDVEPGDQVLVLSHASQTELEPAGSWDSLGMRGTCSPGFVVRARVSEEQVLPIPFARIAVETMVPFSHLLWGHVWLGIASAAYERARAFVRAGARSDDTVTPAARRLSALAVELQTMRLELAAATDEYATMIESESELEHAHTVDYAVRINMLKISASEHAPSICAGALSICGMAGYKNDTPFSVGRHLRDALSGALMIANERIHATNAALLLVHKGG